VEEVKEATDESPETEGTQEEQQPESVEDLKARLATAEQEADRAKRFIVNFVSGKGETERQAPHTDTLAAVQPGDFIEEFKENPVGTLDRHFATRMAPIVADNLEARAKDNRSRAIERLGAETWNEYGDEIDRFMGGLSLHTRANPGSYEEALHFVRARNIDKEIEKRVNARMKSIEDEKRAAVEGGGSRSGASASNGRSAPAMTEVERQIAKGFGMSEKEWMKYKTPKERRNG
jgi:hypothetical protein